MKNIIFTYYKINKNLKEKFLSCIDKGKFSFSMEISISNNINGNSIFMIYLEDEIYISNSSNKRITTSIDRAITLSNFQKLSIKSINEITPYLNNRTKRIFYKKISTELSSFSKKLNEEIYQYFLKNHQKQLDYVLNNRYTLENQNSFLQYDAIYFAMSIAKIDTTFKLESVEIKNDVETELIRLSEDNVITFDTNNDVQGLNREITITGKAIFRNSFEEFIIYTANKTPLEHLFGIDLIYVNNIQKNMVMVQYKMLEKEGNSWVFRDKNNQLSDEIERMNKVRKTLIDYSQDEYRLNPSPFFLRFIKRKSYANNPISFCISLDHYQQIINQPITLGSRGGRRIGYDEMQKHYIGKSELEGLIRSGYIGTYSEDTDNIDKIIRLISEGNSDNGLVIAFKKKLVS